MGPNQIQNTDCSEKAIYPWGNGFFNFYDCSTLNDQTGYST